MDPGSHPNASVTIAVALRVYGSKGPKVGVLWLSRSDLDELLAEIDLVVGLRQRRSALMSLRTRDGRVGYSGDSKLADSLLRTEDWTVVEPDTLAEFYLEYRTDVEAREVTDQSVVWSGYPAASSTQFFTACLSREALVQLREQLEELTRPPVLPTLTMGLLSVEVNCDDHMVTVAWNDWPIALVVIPALGANGHDATSWTATPSAGHPPNDHARTVGVGPLEYLLAGPPIGGDFQRLLHRPLPRFTVRAGIRTLRFEQTNIPRADHYRSQYVVVDEGAPFEDPRYSVFGRYDGTWDVWDHQDPDRPVRGDLAADGLESLGVAVQHVVGLYISGAADQYATYCGGCGSTHDPAVSCTPAGSPQCRTGSP